jgi:pyrroline-5-carboxylate reductase
MTIGSSRFQQMRIGIIGLGNVGWALGRGLRRAAHQAQTVGCDRNAEKRERFSQTTGIPAYDDWKEVIEFADFILVCIRHGQVLPFLEELRHTASPEKVIACLAAAVSVEDLRKNIAPSLAPVVRAVTNVNVASRSGLTVVLRNPPGPTAQACATIIDLFEALGEVIVTESETDLDRWSVLSGCGPAATAIFLEALCDFGTKAGFDAAVARDVAVQCVSASLHTLRHVNVDLETFKRSVAAPGGVVAKLLNAPESGQIETAVVQWFDYIMERMERRAQ